MDKKDYEHLEKNENQIGQVSRSNGSRWTIKHILANLELYLSK